MLKAEVLSIVESTAMIAMLRMRSADDALGMAGVLIEAGIPCIQVPLTVPGATEVITELRRSHPAGVLIGAGTVLDAKAAEACFAADAQFIVSPIADPPTIRRCNEAGVLVAAGALTPTEIHMAWRAGADLVRVYPCAALGGPAYIKFLMAPMPELRLLAAGGVQLQTAAEFIAAGAAALEVDTDLVDLDALHGDRTPEIVTNAHLYIDVIVEALSMRRPPEPET